LLFRWIVLLVALVAACQRTPDPGGKADPTAKPSTSAAAADALCKEHGVLEVICTKCHPKLAAVFQAKGDWCPEHGFPESVCPICHPERGGRPGRDVTAKAGEGKAAEGDGPADGTKVRFKNKEIARKAGIQTAKAEERTKGGGVVATAKLVYDATRLARVNARSAGVVRELKVDVGAKVKKGATLAVIESAEVGADRSKLRAARARVEAAEKDHARQQMLKREGVSSTKDVIDAERELEAAKAEQAGLASALSVAGAGAGSGGSYTLTAPLAGVVTQRTVTIGKLVGLEELLFEIVDTSAMWAELDVPESDLPSVALEQRVFLQLDGLPGRELSGAIAYVSPEIDSHTRTARARVPLENADGALRANMFGRARIVAAGAQVAVMVPDSAVQRAKSVQLVFLRRAEDEYEARRVEVGSREGNMIEILKGISAGDEVATQGSFLLKTETLKDSIGAGCCDVD
jgi:cobalt-zinc-cadmium efflux system membrane fusion protein